MSAITVYSTRKIITMDPNRPEATHVTVRDGRILAVGGWRPSTACRCWTA